MLKSHNRTLNCHLSFELHHLQQFANIQYLDARTVAENRVLLKGGQWPDDPRPTSRSLQQLYINDYQQHTSGGRPEMT